MNTSDETPKQFEPLDKNIWKASIVGGQLVIEGQFHISDKSKSEGKMFNKVVEVSPTLYKVEFSSTGVGNPYNGSEEPVNFSCKNPNLAIGSTIKIEGQKGMQFQYEDSSIKPGDSETTPRGTIIVGGGGGWEE